MQLAGIASSSVQSYQRREHVTVSTQDIINIVERSLYQHYLVDLQIFNVQTLIRKDRKVHVDLLNKLEALIQKKVN